MGIAQLVILALAAIAAVGLGYFFAILARVKRLEEVLGRIVKATGKGFAVTARSFQVRDERGTIRAFLGTTVEGKTSMVLFDKEHRRPRLELYELPESVGFNISDERGLPRVMLELCDRESPEGPALSLVNENCEKNILVLPGGISILGGGGEVRAEVSLSQGTSTVALRDEEGRRRVVVSEDGGMGHPTLTFYAKNDDACASIALFEKTGDILPLSVIDKNGIARVVLAVPDTKCPALILCNGEGEHMWQAPQPAARSD